MMMKTFLQVFKEPGRDLKKIKDGLTGNNAIVTDRKALHDSGHRETIQQATDKRVAIEGLVIKDLFCDLKCQWRWVNLERQLSDGLAKVGAKQSFVARYKDGYIQLVADHAFTAAKRKSKEQRAETVKETKTSRSEIANSFVALVMAASATEVSGQGGDGWDTRNSFDAALMVTVLLGVLTMLWMMSEVYSRFCTRGKGEDDEMEVSKAPKTKKTDNDDKSPKRKLPKIKTEDDVTELQQKFMEVSDQLDYTHNELSKTNKKVRLMMQERQQSQGDKISRSSSSNDDVVIFIIPYGECWHANPKCVGPGGQGYRPYRRCCH